MAYILIDGYNLTGIAHDNLEKVRNDLIEKLKKYSETRKHHITLVFDGWKSGQKDQTEMKTRDVTVIYSRLGEKADLVIKRLVKASTVPCIVVSSDREISDYADKHNHTAVSSAEFEEKLCLALRTPAEDDVDTGPAPYPPARSGGNPRQLSKRQKKKIQALLKL
jgi:predicted RNA-binding protein with PIN domain